MIFLYFLILSTETIIVCSLINQTYPFNISEFSHYLYFYLYIYFINENFLKKRPNFRRLDVFTNNNDEEVSCIAHCYRCSSENSCEICSQRYYFNSFLNICEKCPENSDGNLCAECVQDSQTWMNTRTNNYFCTFATDIQEMYYLANDGNLVSCGEGCGRCTNSSNCVFCSTGYYKQWVIENEQNMQKCVKCSSFNPLSTECLLYDTTNIVNLNENSIDFTLYSDNLTVFQSKTKVFETMCNGNSIIRNNSEGRFQCQTADSIENCENYIFSDENNAVFSNTSINEFLTNASALMNTFALKCVQCKEKYFLNENSGECSKCPENCIKCSSSGACVECDGYSYLETNNMTLLPECKRCNETFENCATCGLAKVELFKIRLNFTEKFKLFCFTCVEGYGVVRLNELSYDNSFTQCKKCENCSECFFNTSSSAEGCLSCLKTTDENLLPVLNLSTFACETKPKSSLDILTNPYNCLQAAIYDNSYLDTFCIKCEPNYTLSYTYGCYFCDSNNCFERREYSENLNNSIYLNFSNILSKFDVFDDYLIDTYLDYYTFKKDVIMNQPCDFQSDFDPSQDYYNYKYTCTNCLENCGKCENSQCFSCNDLNASLALYEIPELIRFKKFDRLNYNTTTAVNLTNLTENSTTRILNAIPSDFTFPNWTEADFRYYPAMFYEIIFLASFPVETLSPILNESFVAELNNTNKILSNYREPQYFSGNNYEKYLDLSKNLLILRNYLANYQDFYNQTIQKCLTCRPGCNKCSVSTTDTRIENSFETSAYYLLQYDLNNCEICGRNAEQDERFIYDFGKKTCKFCPEPWSNCRAYIKQTFLVDCANEITVLNDTNVIVVKNTEELATNLSKFSSDLALFVFKEFYVEEIETKILFSTKSECNAQETLSTSSGSSVNTTLFQIYNITTNLTNLKNYTIKIGVFEYDLGNASFSEYNGDDIGKNAKIYLKNLGGLAFNNVSYLEMRNLNISLDNSQFITNTSQVNYLVLKNIVIESTSTVKNNLVFYFYTTDYIVIQGITFNNLTDFEILELFSFVYPIEIQVKNINFTNSSFKNSASSEIGYIFYLSSQILTISDINIINCSFDNVTIFGDDSTTIKSFHFLDLLNITISQSNFRSKSAIFKTAVTITKFIYFDTFNISLNNFTGQISENMVLFSEYLTTLSNFFVFYNNFTLALLFDIDFQGVSEITIQKITLILFGLAFDAHIGIDYVQGLMNFYDSTETTIFTIMDVNITIFQDPFFTTSSSALIILQNFDKISLEQWKITYSVDSNQPTTQYSARVLTNYLRIYSIKTALLNNFYLTSDVAVNTSVESPYKYFFNFVTINVTMIRNFVANQFFAYYALFMFDNGDYNSDSFIYLNESSFTSNEIIAIVSHGSLIIINKPFLITKIYFYMYNCLFFANNISELTRPSLISSEALSTEISMESTKFISNFPRNLMIYSEKIYIKNCVFSDIVPSSSDFVYPVAFLEYVEMEIDSVYFNNIQTLVFSLKNLLKDMNLRIFNCTFINIDSRSTQDRSLFVFSSKNNQNSNITAENLMVTSCYCPSNGLLFFLSGRGNYFLNISGLNFTKSQGNSAGIIVFVIIASSFNLFVSDSIISDLTSQACLYIDLPKATFCSFSNITVENFQQTSQFYYNSKGTTIIKNSRFLSNVFNLCSFFLIKNAVLLEITNSSFISNVNNANEVSFDQINTPVSFKEIELSPYLKKLYDTQTNKAPSLIQIYEGNVSISDSIFANNSCIMCIGTILQLTGVSSFYISIKNSTFSGNIGFSGGALYLYQGFNITDIANNYSLIENSLFFNNSAYFGGAVCLSFVNLRLNFVNFSNNSAKNYTETITENQTSLVYGKGGAIFYESSIFSKNSLFLNNISLSSSSANVGGAIFETGKDFFVENSSVVNYSNNSAFFHGSNCFSTPTKLKMLFAEGDFLRNTGNSSNLEEIFSGFKPGGAINQLIFQFLDENDVVVTKFEDSPTLEISLLPEFANDSSYYMTGTQEIAINSQDFPNFTFSGLSLLGNSSKNYRLSIKSSLFPSDFNGTCVSPRSLNISVKFRTCVRGEIFKNLTKTCEDCVGKYSLQENSTQCNECDYNKMSSCNRDEIFIKPDYWRSSIYTDKIQACKIEGLCIGDGETLNSSASLCKAGHIGALCQSCDSYGLYGEKYYKVSDSICKKCSEFDVSSVIFACMLVFNIVIMAVAAKGVIEMIEIEQKLKIIKKVGFLFSRYRAQHKQIYVKTLVNYFQIVSVVGSLDLKLPGFLEVISRTVGNPSDVLLHSGDCFISEWFKSPKLLYSRAILIIVLPLFYVLAYALLYFLAVLLKLTKMRLQIFYSASLFALIYLQPNVVDTIVALLSCSSVTGLKFIKADMFYECYTHEHVVFSVALLTPSLFFWALLFPVVIFLMVFKERRSLQCFHNQLKYGFLVNEYKPQCFYWEFVKICEKIAIILFLNFFDTEIIIKGLLILLVIFAYFLALIYKKPFKSLELLKVDCVSCFVCFFSIFFGVFAYQNESATFLMISYIVIISVNVYFVVFIFYKILAMFFENQQGIPRFCRNFPYFGKIFKRNLEEKDKVSDNWKRVRKAVNKYLVENRKKSRLRCSIFNKNQRIRTELDEEILKEIRLQDEEKLKFLEKKSVCEAKSEEIEENAQNIVGNYLFSVKSPTSLSSNQ